MVTVFPSTSYTYFQVGSARLQYLLNLASCGHCRGRAVRRTAADEHRDFIDICNSVSYSSLRLVPVA